MSKSQPIRILTNVISCPSWQRFLCPRSCVVWGVSWEKWKYDHQHSKRKNYRWERKTRLFIWCDWHGLLWQLNFYFHVLFVENWAKTNLGVQLKLMYSNIFSQREVLFRWLKVDCWRGSSIVFQPSVYFCFYLRVPITWRHAAKRGFVWAKSKFINNKRDRIV